MSEMLATAHRPLLRQCVACRVLQERSGLIRLVAPKDGEVSLDNRQKIEGRGAYVCRNRGCIEQALRRGNFNKALRRNVPESILKDVLALGQEMS